MKSWHKFKNLQDSLVAERHSSGRISPSLGENGLAHLLKSSTDCAKSMHILEDSLLYYTYIDLHANPAPNTVPETQKYCLTNVCVKLMYNDYYICKYMSRQVIERKIDAANIKKCTTIHREVKVF